MRDETESLAEAGDAPGRSEREEIGTIVSDLFRRQVGVVTAVLTRSMGAEVIDFIDDAVQEAMVAALRVWSIKGIPSNPTGWLVSVARNRARDELRRRTRLAALASENDGSGLAHLSASDTDATTSGEGEELSVLDDDQLRLVFMCCHPELSPESRVALTLKCVSGLGVGEIARALGADERAVAQRLVRAKRSLASVRASFEVPPAAELPARLEDVLAVIYGVFNEAHHATAGEELVRLDLANEAIRLAQLLLDTPLTRQPQVHALQALMLLTAARFPARCIAGRVVPLADQDRARWDGRRIRRGFEQLLQAAAGDRLTRYHVEAEIAGLHATAPTYAETDWTRVVSAYDELLHIAPTPMVQLARAIALAESGDVTQAWELVDRLAVDPSADRLPHVHAAAAELARRLGRTADAQRALERALALPTPSAVHHHLVDQLARLGTADGRR